DGEWHVHVHVRAGRRTYVLRLFRADILPIRVSRQERPLERRRGIRLDGHAPSAVYPRPRRGPARRATPRRIVLHIPKGRPRIDVEDYGRGQATVNAYTYGPWGE